MKIRAIGGYLAALLFACTATLSHAGLSITANLFTASPSEAVSVFNPGQIRTFTIEANVSNAGLATINGLQLANNAGGQFQIVPGGTCALNSTLADNATCTVNIQYLGGTVGVFTGELQVSCTTLVAAPGGFSVSCQSQNAIVYGIMARLYGALANVVVPTLGAANLTAMSLALFALAAFFGLRRGAK